EAVRRSAGAFLASGADGLPLVEIWRGLRPCTPDGLPLVGRPRKVENLVMAAGHAMVGMSLGPATGKLVAQLAGGAAPPADVSLLDPDRFG
ncbi:MAG TPA: FAD-dependent oxidoreductase, partial [Methylomirabilota bacterium]